MIKYSLYICSNRFKIPSGFCFPFIDSIHLPKFQRMKFEDKIEEIIFFPKTLDEVIAN